MLSSYKSSRSLSHLLMSSCLTAIGACLGATAERPRGITRRAVTGWPVIPWACQVTHVHQSDSYGPTTGTSTCVAQTVLIDVPREGVNHNSRRQTVAYLVAWANLTVTIFILHNQTQKRSINESINQSVNQSVRQLISQWIRSIDWWSIDDQSMIDRSIH